MNIRKLAARLNAKAPQFTIGNGGVPEFTPQDIAAGLGMVTDAIGREIFCMAWWPDGGRLTRKDLRDGLKNLLFEEFKERRQSDVAAKLDDHLNGRELRFADKNKPWPGQLSRYGEVADAVVVEICTPRLCKQCGGRGEAVIDDRVIQCTGCSGLGLLPASQAWRAQQIGVSETTYRQTWRQVYEWLYERASNRESTAAKQLARALGDLDKAA